MSDFKTPDDIPLAIGTVKAEAVQPKKNDISHILQHANIPRRYKDAELNAITDGQKQLIAQMKSNISSKKMSDVRDMLIYGGIGTGKTHIAIALIRKLISNGIYCRYATEHELLELYFQKQYSKFDGFKEASILVIDEIGKRPLVDWQMIQLEELVSTRYNDMKSTIFITNLTEKDFKKFVGDRVADRMRDNEVIRVSLVGGSLRGGKA